MTGNPYRTDLTPEQRGRWLIIALREIAPQQIYHVAGDGEFLWNYGYILEDANKLRGDPFLDNFTIPKDFCGTVGCAAGLGYLLGLVEDEAPSCGEMAVELGLDTVIARDIFFNPDIYNEFGDWDAVTPAMVADVLEAELDKKIISHHHV